MADIEQKNLKIEQITRYNITEKEIFKTYDNLKLVSAIFFKKNYFSPNDSSSKTMKDIFYFI